MSSGTTYFGSNGIVNGNGGMFAITHNGKACLPTIIDTSLTLNNFLHAPSMFAKLIFVRNLCHDNRVFVEVHYNDFLVKDILSKKVIL